MANKLNPFRVALSQGECCPGTHGHGMQTARPGVARLHALWGALFLYPQSCSPSSFWMVAARRRRQHMASTVRRRTLVDSLSHLNERWTDLSRPSRKGVLGGTAVYSLAPFSLHACMGRATDPLEDLNEVKNVAFSHRHTQNILTER